MSLRRVAPLIFAAALGMPVKAQERTIEEYDRLLNGRLFESGWIDNLKPENASADHSTDYRKALEGIIEFLMRYDKKDLPEKYQSLHKDAVAALTANLFVDDKKDQTIGTAGQGLNERIRAALIKEKVLNYREQIEELEAASVQTIRAAYMGNLEQRAAYAEHGKQLLTQAEAAIGCALATRYQLTMSDVSTEDVQNVIETHREAYEALKKLQKALAERNNTTALKQVKTWKSKQAQGLQQLLDLQEKAEAGGTYATGNWTTVTVYENGEPLKLHVTRQFATDWSDNGEKMYGPLESIKKNVRKLEMIAKGNELQTEFSVNYADKIEKQVLAAGSLITKQEEVIVPVELSDILRCGEKLRVYKEGTYKTFEIVGFSSDKRVYLPGEPGLFLPKDLHEWTIIYRQGAEIGDIHHASLKK